jgi:hypothetical protein
LLVAAGGFLFVNHQVAARTPKLTGVLGTVNRETGPIPPGETLRTGSNSSAVIAYSDGSVVELDHDTTLIVRDQSPWSRSKEIEIVSGKVTAKVARQREGRQMTFSSDDARAEVVGTKLSFQSNDGVSRLEVTEGAVRFVPRSGGAAVLVRSGLFAESGKSGFRSGRIEAPTMHGITRFTLMNAETNQPIRNGALVDGATISLASLPTRKINIRADFEGATPNSVKIDVVRSDGEATGLPAHVARAQKYPPFFAAGDYWSEGRPEDCRAWTPRSGVYYISAKAEYSEYGEKSYSKVLEMKFQIID